MSDTVRERIFTLAKVMIAAAWADGQITDDEKQCLKDLLFHLPDAGLDAGIQMTGQDWSRLEMYMETPIDDAERTRLIADLQSAIHDERKKQLVINYLEMIVSVDGEPTTEEQALIAEIDTAVNAADTGVLDKLNRFLGGALQRRSKAVAQAPNRERYFDDFVKNKVYYEVQQRLETEGKTLALSDEALRTLGLAGGLMARVAYVDRQVTADEETAMVDIITRHWEVDRETAVFVAHTAVSSLDASYDYYRMTREFGLATTPDERRRFLDVLFQVALADGFVTYDETEEIRSVARAINLPNEEFISAKIKIPRDKRAG